MSKFFYSDFFSDHHEYFYSLFIKYIFSNNSNLKYELFNYMNIKLPHFIKKKNIYKIF